MDGGFEAFYRVEVDRAMGLAALLTTRDDAHDLVQDAFVGLLRHWDDTDQPAAYLRRSIANGAANVHRRRSSERAKRAAAARVLPSSVHPRDDYLVDLLQILTAKQRAVVVLRFYLQLQEREIADALQMRPGSVGPTLSRALAQLKKELRDDL